MDEIVTFTTTAELWAWLTERPATHPGVWVRLGRSRGRLRTISFEELLEAGLAFGWSESGRRRYDADSYLQRFSPRRTTGTASARNLRIANRLIGEGRMTPRGLAALGLD
ncbi:YdeI/OmpD-associated family protein [Nocardioides sp.]|uniref:YdeI/OmpD-associated family protein n=1 Tax=Nocardioides sp. TaxID=35761 RepID=UPI0039E514A8